MSWIADAFSDEAAEELWRRTLDRMRERGDDVDGILRRAAETCATMVPIGTRVAMCPYGSPDHVRDDACPACAVASERTGLDA